MPRGRNSLSLSLLLSVLLGPEGPGQAPATSQIQGPMVRPDPKRAQKAVERGDKAQAAGNLDEALQAYEEAARYAPHEGYVLERGAALRSRVVRVDMEGAERDAMAGRLTEATDDLAAALRIDPSNKVVAERLAQLKAMDDGLRAKPQSGSSGLPRLHPQAGKHNLNLRGDTKTVYEQFAGLFGVKASFDPDLVVRTVQLRVDDVDFYTGMSLLGSQSGTFWRPVNPTLLFVAPDTPEQRRQYGLEVEQT